MVTRGSVLCDEGVREARSRFLRQYQPLLGAVVAPSNSIFSAPLVSLAIASIRERLLWGEVLSEHGRVVIGGAAAYLAICIGDALAACGHDVNISIGRDRKMPGSVVISVDGGGRVIDVSRDLTLPSPDGRWCGQGRDETITAAGTRHEFSLGNDFWYAIGVVTGLSDGDDATEFSVDQDALVSFLARDFLKILGLSEFDEALRKVAATYLTAMVQHPGASEEKTRVELLLSSSDVWESPAGKIFVNAIRSRRSVSGAHEASLFCGVVSEEAPDEASEEEDSPLDDLLFEQYVLLPVERSFEKQEIAAALLGKYPEDERAKVIFAHALLTGATCDEGERLLRTMLHGRPKYPDAHTTLAGYLGCNRRVTEALDVIRSAVTLWPSAPHVLELACALENVGCTSVIESTEAWAYC